MGVDCPGLCPKSSNVVVPEKTKRPSGPDVNQDLGGALTKAPPASAPPTKKQLPDQAEALKALSIKPMSDTGKTVLCAASIITANLCSALEAAPFGNGIASALKAICTMATNSGNTNEIACRLRDHCVECCDVIKLALGRENIHQQVSKFQATIKEIHALIEEYCAKGLPWSWIRASADRNKFNALHNKLSEQLQNVLAAAVLAPVVFEAVVQYVEDPRAAKFSHAVLAAASKLAGRKFQDDVSAFDYLTENGKLLDLVKSLGMEDQVMIHKLESCVKQENQKVMERLEVMSRQYDEMTKLHRERVEQAKKDTAKAEEEMRIQEQQLVRANKKTLELQTELAEAMKSRADWEQQLAALKQQRKQQLQQEAQRKYAEINTFLSKCATVLQPAHIQLMAENAGIQAGNVHQLREGAWQKGMSLSVFIKHFDEKPVFRDDLVDMYERVSDSQALAKDTKSDLLRKILESCVQCTTA